MAAQHFDKVYILDPAGASWATSSVDYHAPLGCEAADEHGHLSPECASESCFYVASVTYYSAQRP